MVLIYTLYGGMWSVALTDFVQMIVITLGLLAIVLALLLIAISFAVLVGLRDRWFGRTDPHVSGPSMTVTV